jgi:hypothetical protein
MNRKQRRDLIRKGKGFKAYKKDYERILKELEAEEYNKKLMTDLQEYVEKNITEDDIISNEEKNDVEGK